MTVDGRARTAAALTGMAALGVVAAGAGGAAPVEIRVLLVLVGAFVAPAFLIAPVVGRFVDGPALPALSFFGALSLHALLSEGFRLAGASFSVYAGAVTWVLLIAFGAVFFVSWTRRGAWPRVSWRPRARVVAALAAVGALCAIAAASRGPFTVAEDAFDHIGYARRVIAYDSMRPDGVLAWPAAATQAPAPDPRKGALHPCIAWVADLAGAGPERVWSLLPLVFYPAFVLAFVAFARALLPTRGLLVGCTALFMLSYAGTAFQFAHAAAYGQNLAAAWYWVLAALALAPLHRAPVARRGRRAAIAWLAFGGTLAHVGVALHGGVLAASLVVFAPWLGLRYRSAAMDAMAVVGASAAAALLRLGAGGVETNPIHSHLQGVLFVGSGWFVMSPMEILRQHGMAFLGGLVLLPLLLVVARRRGDARAALALSVLPVGIAFVPPLATALFQSGSYMAFRALLNAPALAAAAIVLGWMADHARRRGGWMRAGIALIVAAWMLAFVRPALDATRADATRKTRSVEDDTRALVRSVESLPGSPTVLSDPATAYLLSAHTAHRFVALYEQHANPRDPLALDRLEAVRDVLSPYASAQRALDACARYGVDFIVLHAGTRTTRPGFMSGWDPARFHDARARLRDIGFPIQEWIEMPEYSVFRVLTTMGAGRAVTAPPPAPVGVESPELAPCTVPAPGRAFEVTGVAVAPAVAAPGDSLTITLGYRRDETTPFGLPFLLHIRFDHESLEGGPAYPGEKYVRRLADRRRGLTTRFRADVRPGGGVFEPDAWPMGVPLAERVGFVVPSHAAPGRYRVEVRVIRDSILPNFHARDLLYHRDHYSGTACTTLEVGPRGGRE